MFIPPVSALHPITYWTFNSCLLWCFYFLHVQEASETFVNTFTIRCRWKANDHVVCEIVATFIIICSRTNSACIEFVLCLLLHVWIPFFSPCCSGTHCCVLPVNVTEYSSHMQPGGCFNLVISARCLPKNIRTLGGTPRFKTRRKNVNKKVTAALGSSRREPDADYFKWFLSAVFRIWPCGG